MTERDGRNIARYLSSSMRKKSRTRGSAAATRRRRSSFRHTSRHRTYHLYNELLISADVLSRTVRIVILMLRVPYLARVRSLEGDSWTHKSQSCTRACQRYAIVDDGDRDIIFAVYAGP